MVMEEERKQGGAKRQQEYRQRQKALQEKKRAASRLTSKKYREKKKAQAAATMAEQTPQPNNNNNNIAAPSPHIQRMISRGTHPDLIAQAEYDEAMLVRLENADREASERRLSFAQQASARFSDLVTSTTP